jgi:diguanylate cyclase (GGDEF)-like protein/PAS domain S-box-containing protein
MIMKIRTGRPHGAFWRVACWGSIGTVVLTMPGALQVLPGSSVTAGLALGVVAAVLLAVACLRVALTAAVARSTRRFWFRLLAVDVLFLAAIAVDKSGTLTTNGAAGSAVFVLYGASSLVMLWAVFGLPTQSRARVEWTTGILDAGTVLVTVALYSWLFPIRSILEATSGPVDLPQLASVVSHGVAAGLVIARACLNCDAPADRRALTLVGLGLLVGFVTQIVDPHLTGYGLAGMYTFTAVSAACALGVWAATYQVRAERVPVPDSARQWWFTVLPCLFVAACSVTLFTVNDLPSGQGRTVVVANLMVAALVMTRLLMTLRDNERLLNRVDAGTLEVYRHEQRFASLLHNATDIVLVTAVDGNVKYASPAMQQVLGIPLERLAGMSLSAYVHPEDQAGAAAAMGRIRAGRGVEVTYHLRARRPDGSWRCLELVSRNLLHDPSVQGIVTNARDVTDARRYREQLAYQSTHDNLTGLANRSTFLAATAAALASHHGADMVSVAIVDIDGFRAINDRLGAGVGDDVLIAIGHQLVRHLGPQVTVARLGGDEFAVLLVGPPAEAELHTVHLPTAVSDPLVALGHDHLIQLSVGLAHGIEGLSAIELTRRAEVAVLEAKELGQGNHVTFDAVHDDRRLEHARIGADLRRALAAGDQLHLLYQPIVALADGATVAVEALVRWQHPEHGITAPDQFIPVAERNGLIVPMGRWILETACRQAASWAGEPALPPIFMNVNVSARQLREPNFATEVADILHTSGLHPNLLTIEVTETAVFDSEAAVRVLNELHHMGVRLALDDFGTGHSSLGLLRICPVDILKVDKSFIDDVTGPPHRAAIAVSLLHITRAMNLVAVAEGVETAEQAETLRQLGYAYAQGFLFARPMAADQVGQYLAHDPLYGPPLESAGKSVAV